MKLYQIKNISPSTSKLPGLQWISISIKQKRVYPSSPSLNQLVCISVYYRYSEPQLLLSLLGKLHEGDREKQRIMQLQVLQSRLQLAVPLAITASRCISDLDGRGHFLFVVPAFPHKCAFCNFICVTKLIQYIIYINDVYCIYKNENCTTCASSLNEFYSTSRKKQRT